jgi:hypothetical protein
MSDNCRCNPDTYATWPPRGSMSSTTQVPWIPAALARPERGVPLGRRCQTGPRRPRRQLPWARERSCGRLRTRNPTNAKCSRPCSTSNEDLVADWPGLLTIADKGFASKEFENDQVMRGAELLRPSFKREKKGKGKGLLKSVRQLTESVNDTIKGSWTWRARRTDLPTVRSGRRSRGVAGLPQNDLYRRRVPPGTTGPHVASESPCSREMDLWFELGELSPAGGSLGSEKGICWGGRARCPAA